MIIWINGAFGSGKTQVANGLHGRIKKSYLFDPEETGVFIRENMPEEVRVDDFQDYPMWCSFNVSMLKFMALRYNGIIICPMTIINKKYFNRLIGELREDGIVVKHFTLLATEETLDKRLKGRGEEEGSWPFLQIERCVNTLEDEEFSEHIITDNKTIQDVIEIIATRCGVS